MSPSAQLSFVQRSPRSAECGTPASTVRAGYVTTDTGDGDTGDGDIGDANTGDGGTAAGPPQAASTSNTTARTVEI